MSSYLDRQSAAFAGSLASAASKITAKKSTTLAPPSPAPSNTSATSGKNDGGKDKSKKRKWDSSGGSPGFTAPGTPAAGGADGGSSAAGAGGSAAAQGQSSLFPSEPISFGNDVLTQLTFVVEYLKDRGTAKSLQEILSHLSQNKTTDAAKSAWSERLRNHPRIQWIPDRKLTEQEWHSGTYEHRPLVPGVRDADSLVAFLQRRTDARGLSVKELKDGWPDCEEAIDQLEREHRILVVRTKKDNHPRLIWPDDPTLAQPVDPDFQNQFLRAEVPSAADLVKRLTAAGQKPASEDPRLKELANAKAKQVKKRTQKRPGKLTNTHMEKLLKDYSDWKR